MAGWPPINLFTASEFATSSKLNSIWTAIQYEQQRAAFLVTRSAALTLAASGFTDIPMDAEGVDSENGHSTVSNTQWCTAQTAGLWLWAGFITVDALAAAGWLGITLHAGRGGGFTLDSFPFAANTIPASNNVHALCCTGFTVMAAGDSVKMRFGNGTASAHAAASDANLGSRASLYGVLLRT